MRRSLAICLIVASLVPSWSARADSGPDAVTAEALFSEGRRLMAAGQVEAACSKFAESLQIEPAPGTSLNLAICYERAGKTASAWQTFRDSEAAAVRAGEKDRAAFAKKKAASLEATLSFVTVEVDATSRVPGLEVRRDGSVLPPGAWGMPLPMDPGPHEIEAAAPNKQKWSARIQVTAGKANQSIPIPLLEDAPTAVVPAAPQVPTVEAVPAAPPVDSNSSFGRAQQITGLSAGALGVVALGVGTYFGFTANSTYKEAKAACGGTTVCATDDGLSLGRDAHRDAAISTVAFIAGGALVVGGAITFFTAPKGASSNRVGLALQPRVAGASFAMYGTW